MVLGTAAADLRRGHVQHRFRRDPDADRHPMGLRLAPICEGAGRPLAVSATAPGLWRRGGGEVSLARLYVMRAVALLGVWGLFATVQTLVSHDAMDRGVHKALISGLWVMAFFALRSPLKMVR